MIHCLEVSRPGAKEGSLMLMDWLKKAPTTVVITVIVVCGVTALGVLGSFVALTLAGYDTSEYRMWINTVGQVVVLPFAGVATVASVSAARSASNAEDQTNGHLASKDAQIVELRAQLADLRRQIGRGNV